MILFFRGTAASLSDESSGQAKNKLKTVPCVSIFKNASSVKENARRGRAHISVQSILTTMAVMVLEGGSLLMTKELR